MGHSRQQHMTSASSNRTWTDLTYAVIYDYMRSVHAAPNTAAYGKQHMQRPPYAAHVACSSTRPPTFLQKSWVSQVAISKEHSTQCVTVFCATPKLASSTTNPSPH
jgi:hypothetical protein